VPSSSAIHMASEETEMPLPRTRICSTFRAGTSASGSSFLVMRNCSPDLPRNEPRSERMMRDIGKKPRKVGGGTTIFILGFGGEMRAVRAGPLAIYQQQKLHNNINELARTHEY